jgi:hypothetical protein
LMRSARGLWGVSSRVATASAAVFVPATVCECRRKGPKGRKNLAQGASPGSRKPCGSREPQRGERKGIDAGTLAGSAAPCGARPALRPGFPGLAPWAKFCCPLRGLTSITHCRKCFDPIETLYRVSNWYNTHHGRFKVAFPFRTAPVSRYANR